MKQNNTAQSKKRTAKAMIRHCKKTNDRRGFRSACELFKVAERELAQHSPVVDEGFENA